MCVSVRSYRTPSQLWLSRRKFSWQMQKNSTSSISQQSWYSLRWIWHASMSHKHSHTHLWSIYENDWPMCVCLEPRGTERWERQAVCVGDGDRGSRYSLCQSVLHVAVTQTESRHWVEDPAGNRNCFRSEHTPKIQSFSFFFFFFLCVWKSTF